MKCVCLCVQATLPQRSRTKVHEELLPQSFDPGVLTTTEAVEDISLRAAFL